MNRSFIKIKQNKKYDGSVSLNEESLNKNHVIPSFLKTVFTKEFLKSFNVFFNKWFQLQKRKPKRKPTKLERKFAKKAKICNTSSKTNFL